VIERRIRSIPPRTTLDALREQEGRRGRIGRGSLRQDNGGFNVEDHVFRKPAQERLSKTLVSPEIEKITWEVETIEDCNSTRDLGLIVRFSGISFMDTPVFGRSRHDYGPDSCVFYSPVGYKNGQAFLILSTIGDIFESQIVPKTKDVNPFFREEIYYPPLLTLYDPTSMMLSYNKGLVIVSYKACG